MVKTVNVFDGQLEVGVYPTSLQTIIVNEKYQQELDRINFTSSLVASQSDNLVSYLVFTAHIKPLVPQNELTQHALDMLWFWSLVQADFDLLRLIKVYISEDMIAVGNTWAQAINQAHVDPLKVERVMGSIDRLAISERVDELVQKKDESDTNNS